MSKFAALRGTSAAGRSYQEIVLQAVEAARMPVDIDDFTRSRRKGVVLLASNETGHASATNANAALTNNEDDSSMATQENSSASTNPQEINSKVEQVLVRLANGEKLLAHACAECDYPCGYIMRGGSLWLDKNCWCLDDLMRMWGKAVRLATKEEIGKWLTDEDDGRLRRLVLYCENRSGWTPENWAEYIGATPEGGAR